MLADSLTTQQFADLCKVERRTLHYYDEIGLLKPAEKKENGYRVYHQNQFDTMSMIKALQSVGMSLDEIKKLMNEEDLIRCREVLDNQIYLIREKQKELKVAEQILRQTTDQLDHYLGAQRDHFFEEYSPDRYLLIQEIPEKKEVFVNYITSGYYLGVIMEEENPVIPKYVFKNARSKKSYDAIKTGGSYACIYQSVPNGRIRDSINNFLSLISNKNIITEGPLYVDSIANDFVQFPNRENIFKLSIKIKNYKN